MLFIENYGSIHMYKKANMFVVLIKVFFLILGHFCPARLIVFLILKTSLKHKKLPM